MTKVDAVPLDDEGVYKLYRKFDSTSYTVANLMTLMQGMMKESFPDYDYDVGTFREPKKLKKMYNLHPRSGYPTPLQVPKNRWVDSYNDAVDDFYSSKEAMFEGARKLRETVSKIKE